MDTTLRNEVCFEAAQTDVAAVFSKLNGALIKSGLQSTVDEEALELRVQTEERSLVLIAFEAPTHNALQLFDEPAEEEGLDDSPEARQVLTALHEVLTAGKYEVEWIGNDDCAESPFGPALDDED